MPEPTRRPPSGAATLRADKTAAISEAVLDELAEQGYGRLSMEAVAKRAGVGKSALYRRWPSKQRMVIAVVSELSVALVELPDTGSLRGDVLAGLRAVADWLTHPRFSRILPDLIAEAQRDQELSQALARCIGEPRRARMTDALDRAVERGELSPDLDRELALDLLGGLVYWRVSARGAPLEPGYFERAADMALRALGARPRGA
ncbi:TetR/AcrR family transcriptional regulator [Streptomyces rapamycinicus]|uniref:TetR family transcriptional regulator n=2 Tax=Streptomyces rapamycinicus TaxID=1226757 RepID=A0A0A0NAI8_STRRN|nr:TetR/AcrR family transcriptional regulator [Streptomyces rapamycinicus]AGP53138.1 TetR family transcriptional regulator [Streptomyces rapamycinicus NRRL 5491]MBB4780622.1 AcrR family transcriptional regulator [Streptomyces rapamycinicus]RLV74727.1 TetR family transcriptional regulator [Streptomyces rapamycinicus NRRL 5491]UTO61334.1 TetR/AcrR family transcriptional regulator [Streptomyces rapamycinicus]UTP29281.1 TetR/AcrR family transcriptional regulator [Streptomyces rapamycinicus NRRL 54